MLAGRQLFGVFRWFQLFCFFHLVSAVCWIDYGSHFHLPPAFVVWSFFLCHRHLWSVFSFFATGICVWSLSFMAFSAVGIYVRLFALLALVSGYQCIPIWCSAIKFTKSHSAKCSLHIWAWLLVWIVQIWPIFASQRVDSAGTRA